MKVYLISKDGTGGGSSFSNNFAKGLGEQRTNDPKEADIIFLSSASMATRDDVANAFNRPDQKFVLRVDNALKDSRNRGTGMTRMRDYANMADAIVYQSEWAKSYLDPVINRKKTKTSVILNGTDTDIFKPEGDKEETNGRNVYTYVRSNRDESKGWHIAWYEFQEIQRADPLATLWIVGKFSKEMLTYGFDFFQGESYLYWGIVDNHQLAKILRASHKLLYTYFFDACSNVLAETIACGTPIHDSYGMLKTGGAPEQMKAGVRSIDDMTKEYETLFEGL